ncbi:MAG TPA: CHAD domain-containing protein, partial [Candidatus Polarisedimenticolaceae bacterium]|nr:CHAD domain-containing protein [Candidatus Polarisedimenticolaceae bacterium]
PIRDAVESLVEMRRLLPLVELVLDGRVWPVLDDRLKTVAEIVVEEGRALEPELPERRVRLDPLLRVVPVAGYDEVVRRLRSLAERAAGIRLHDGCRLERTLVALGRDPARESAKPGYRLEPNMRSDDAMKSIHRVLLDTMQRNEGGIRADIDSEFLHDFRVAVRRTRSGLAQVPDVFPRAVVSGYRERFAWLGERTGPLRDLDVHRLTLRQVRRELPEELRHALDPFEAELGRRRAEEHGRLVHVLDSARYAQLVERWRGFLNKPSPRRTSLGNAMRPIRAVAGERILEAWRKVIKRGHAIEPDSPARRLHRLRISCKKLRYLLEFFAELYPEAELARVIRPLKKLQNNLGEFNDLAVQRREVLDWRGAAQAAAPTADETEAAAALLLDRIDRDSRRTRAQFDERFAAFETARIGTLFARLFGERAG